MVIWLVGRRKKKTDVFDNKREAVSYAKKIGSEYITQLKVEQIIKLRKKKRKKLNFGGVF